QRVDPYRAREQRRADDTAVGGKRNARHERRARGVERMIRCHELVLSRDDVWAAPEQRRWHADRHRWNREPGERHATLDRARVLTQQDGETVLLPRNGKLGCGNLLLRGAIVGLSLGQIERGA